MISGTAWHLTKEGKQIPFVRSFKIIATVEKAFTTILVETHKIDDHGVPFFAETEEKEYYVRDIHHCKGNPTIEVADILENESEFLP